MTTVPPRGVPFPTPMPGYSGTNESQFRRMLETRLRDMQQQIDADSGGGSTVTVVRGIGATFDASPAEVSSAVAQRVAVPFAGTITGWRVYSGAGGSGSALFDVLVNGVSIVASAPPVIVGSSNASSTALTGWTTAFAAGDMFAFVVVSSSAFDNVTVFLQANETTP